MVMDTFGRFRQRWLAVLFSLTVQEIQWEVIVNRSRIDFTICGASKTSAMMAPLVTPIVLVLVSPILFIALLGDFSVHGRGRITRAGVIPTMTRGSLAEDPLGHGRVVSGHC